MGLSQSKDGRLMALTDSTNGDTFLFDRETSKLRKLIARNQLRWCPRTVLSPDGRILATVAYGVEGKDRKKCKVNVWETAGGAELEGIADDFHLCYQILFSPDGGHLITVESVPGGPITVVRIWAISEHTKRITLVESLRGDALRARVGIDRRAAAEDGTRPFRLSDLLAITPDERQTVAVSLETGETVLYARSGYIRAVCRAMDTEVVVVPRTDLDTAYGSTELEEIAREARLLTRRARSRVIGVDAPILVARFSRDGRVVAAFEALKNKRPRGMIHVFDVATGESGRRLARLDVPEFQCFDFALRGDALVLMSPGVSVWELPEWPLAGHQKEVWGLAFAPDGRTLASSSDDHTIKLWDMESGREKKTLAGHGSLVTEIAYSPDGKTLASAGWDKTVRLWNGSSGALVKTFLGHPAHVRVVAFSPDGKTLASACDGGEIRLCNVSTRREQIGPLRAPGPGVGFASLVFAPDGETLFSAGNNAMIYLWDPHRGEIRGIWAAEDNINSMAISPDGQTLAVAHVHGTIRLWDVRQAKLRAELAGHFEDVWTVAFSPDGLTLASGGRDNTVRLWDPVSGEQLVTLKGHSAPVHAVAFSPDGSLLATGSHDGAIKLWRGPSPAAAHESGERSLMGPYRSAIDRKLLEMPESG
jgi:WD40 repeat protein